ncbi:MAG: SAM-dependent methyltransferase, partial [Chitinophagia bacterium]|nr:SAM-dependent methyltransferase [Chitinophagia bacterium]
MAYIDLLSAIHKSTQRDYLARVNDLDYPKSKAATLAKQWGFDYWDGDRKI